MAAVQGNAVGVGTTMLLHMDLVVASEDAKFITPFADLGAVPEAGSAKLIPAWLGYQRPLACCCCVSRCWHRKPTKPGWWPRW